MVIIMKAKLFIPMQRNTYFDILTIQLKVIYLIKNDF